MCEFARGLAMQLHNTPSACEDYCTRHANKQSVLHDSRHVAELARQRIGIPNLSEVAVENGIAFVSDVGRAVSFLTQTNLCAESRNLLGDERLSELDDFNRQRELA